MEIEINLSSNLDVEVLSQVANRFSDLADVDTNGVSDKYVVMYDATTQTYKLVNPDQILNAAATEPVQPGLVGYASTFLSQLDTDLDNKIDVDAGTF